MVDKNEKDEKFDFVGDEPFKDSPVDDGGDPKKPPIPDGVNVMSIESAGVLVDSTGHTWTIPEKDETDIHYRSRFTIPRPDPLMSYQFFRKADEVTEAMGEQWVPCTREEIGVAVFKNEGDELGPLDRYHVIGTQICMKKPKILVDRQYAAQKRVCDAAVSQTEPPPPGKDAKEQSARNGAQRGQRRYTLDRKTEKVTPKNAENEQVSGLE